MSTRLATPAHGAVRLVDPGILRDHPAGARGPKSGKAECHADQQRPHPPNRARMIVVAFDLLAASCSVHRCQSGGSLRGSGDPDPNRKTPTEIRSFTVTLP